MGELIQFDATARRSTSPRQATQQIPYETYLAYQQAEAAFRALYFGRPFEVETLTNRRPSTKIVQRHWSTVEQLAETFLRQKSLSREQVTKLLLHASLDSTMAAQH